MNCLFKFTFPGESVGVCCNKNTSVQRFVMHELLTLSSQREKVFSEKICHSFIFLLFHNEKLNRFSVNSGATAMDLGYTFICGL